MRVGGLTQTSLSCFHTNLIPGQSQWPCQSQSVCLPQARVPAHPGASHTVLLQPHTHTHSYTHTHSHTHTHTHSYTHTLIHTLTHTGITLRHPRVVVFFETSPKINPAQPLNHKQ